MINFEQDKRTALADETEPVQDKEKEAENLRRRLHETTDEKERAELEKKLEKLYPRHRMY